MFEKTHIDFVSSVRCEAHAGVLESSGVGVRFLTITKKKQAETHFDVTALFHILG